MINSGKWFHMVGCIDGRPHTFMRCGDKHDDTCVECGAEYIDPGKATGPEWKVRVPTERETIVREMLPRVMAAYISTPMEHLPAQGVGNLVEFLYSIADEFIAQGKES